MWKQRGMAWGLSAVMLLLAISGLARNSYGAVAEEQVLQEIQEQIISFRKEFKQRIARTEEDREAVYKNIHKKFSTLNDSQLSLNELEPEMLGQLEKIQPSLAQYGEQIVVLEEMMTAMETTMQSRLDDLEAQLVAEKAGVSRGAAPQRRPVGNEGSTLPPLVEAGAEEGEEEGSSLNLSEGELFRLAYRFYTEGDYDVAIGGFQKYLIDFPKGQLAGPAQYWIAESFLKLEEYEIARQEFERLIGQYPRDNKVADAHYGIGVAVLRLGNVAEAQAKFQDVLDRFGGTIAAERAKRRLED